MNSSSARFSPWIVAAVVVLLDQATKMLVVKTMALHQTIIVWGDALWLTYIHNYGMLFGLKFMGGRLLGAVSLVAAFLFIFMLFKMRDEPTFMRILFGGIIGGAIGNTIDRLVHGYVIDFIHTDFPDFIMERWPVFNVADSAVVVCVTGLIVYLLFFQKADRSNSVEELVHEDGETVQPTMETTSSDGDPSISE